jgi:hypothetical protein
MAETLAKLHWVAKVDANDMEFVLGGSRPDSKAVEYNHSVLGPHALWILDFDLCRPITMDHSGVTQAAEALMKNGPYYPRPAADGPGSKLWIEFSARYLEHSRELVVGRKDVSSDLPDMFITKIVDLEELGSRRRAGGQSRE